MPHTGTYEYPKPKEDTVIPFKSNVVRLADFSDAHRSATDVLQELLAVSDRIQHVMVVVQWDTEQYGYHINTIPYRELVFMEKVVAINIAMGINEAVGDVMVPATPTPGD